MTDQHAPLLDLPEGAELGVSEWTTVSQADIDAFGHATRDHDLQHVDPAWAKANSPFGGTILFGFQTIALLTWLMRSATRYVRSDADAGLFLNYGFDRLRLVSPIPVDRRFRGRFIAGPIRADKGERRIRTIHVTVEVEGEDRPALVADWLTAFVPPDEEGRLTIRE